MTFERADCLPAPVISRPSFPFGPVQRPTALTAIVISALLAPGPGSGQERLTIDGDGSSCGTCAIHLVPTIRIGGADHDLAGVPLALQQDSRGFVVLATSRNPTEILVYDAAGRFLRRVGREGAGPGEYRRVSWLSAHNDTVYVFDGGNSRYVVLSPEWEAVRTASLPFRIHQAIPLGPGPILANAAFSDPDPIGFPLALISDSSVGDPFGTDDPVFRPDLPYVTMRSLARSPRGSSWVATRTQYMIRPVHSLS